MRKIITFVVFIILIFFFISNQKENQDIRVRIIPNSNSDADLLVKEEVKKITIDFLGQNYSSDRDCFIISIKNNLEDLTSEFSSRNIEAVVSLENHNFYNKTYNGSSIKNESVLTLLVTIKNGEGDNWWGSIYPEFLDISSSEVVEYESYIKKLFTK